MHQLPPSVAEHQHVMSTVPYGVPYGSTGAATVPLGSYEGSLMSGHIPAAARTFRAGGPALPYAPRYPMGPSYVTGSSHDFSQQGSSLMVSDSLQQSRGAVTQTGNFVKDK